MKNHAISQRPDAHAAVMERPHFDAESKEIRIPSPFAGGWLSFTTDQRVITADQMAILAPLGIEANWSVPHVAAFLADCYARGLDPWAREAYLMKYPGDKYVRHIGIAGFLRIAEESGEFEGIDQVTYYDQANKPYKVWPFKDRVPYAAEVTAHRKGRRPATVVALYDEYCPLEEQKKWVDDPTRPNGRKRIPTGGGKVPTPMWQTAELGGKPTVMLGKCVRAAALRLLFPRKFVGFYEPAEFERAAQEMADVPPAGDERARARREAYDAAHGAGPVTEGADIGVEIIDQPGPEAPAAAAQASTGAEVRALLLGELDAQALLLGIDGGWQALTEKWSAARGGQPFDTATLATMTAHVHRYREYVIGKLRDTGRADLAARYASAPVVGTLTDLFGTDEPWASESAVNGAGVKTTAGAPAGEAPAEAAA